jgi:hypothetical protein
MGANIGKNQKDTKRPNDSNQKNQEKYSLAKQKILDNTHTSQIPQKKA